MNSPLRSVVTRPSGPVGAQPDPGQPPGPSGTPLDQLGLNVPALVCCIDPAAAGQPAERVRQLADIGFVPGERVTVLTRAWPGNDPLVVLVGHSRFALRSAEAACIRVQAIARQQ